MAARYKLPPSVPAHRTLVADTSSSYWATREGLESTETVPGTAAMVSDGFSLKFRNLKNIAHVTNQIRALLRMRIQNRREIGSSCACAHKTSGKWKLFCACAHKAGGNRTRWRQVPLHDSATFFGSAVRCLAQLARDWRSEEMWLPVMSFSRHWFFVSTHYYVTF